MIFAVYRHSQFGDKQLVHICESEEAAETVASEFIKNRMFSRDCYSVKTFDPRRYLPSMEVPEFVHQVVPIDNEHLYYVFFRFDDDWSYRIYMDANYARTLNSTKGSLLYAIRTNSEEEAVEQFNVLKRMGVI